MKWIGPFVAALCAHRGYLRGHLRSRGLPKLDALHPRACLLTPPLQFASLVTRLFPGLENVGFKKIEEKKKAAARPRLPILELCCSRAAPGGACWEKVGVAAVLSLRLFWASSGTELAYFTGYHPVRAGGGLRGR